MKDEALRLALETLQDYVEEYGPHEKDSGAAYAITAIKQALEQPEPEPVKVMGFDCVCGRRLMVESSNGVVASPPKREPLTDEQIIKMRKELNPVHGQVFNSLEFARAIEQAHGIGGKK